LRRNRAARSNRRPLHNASKRVGDNTRSITIDRYEVSPSGNARTSKMEGARIRAARFSLNRRSHLLVWPQWEAGAHVPQGRDRWRRSGEGSSSASTTASDTRVPDAIHFGSASTAYTALEVSSRGELGPTGLTDTGSNGCAKGFGLPKLSRRKYVTSTTGKWRCEPRDPGIEINRRR
jgi:hypothetical protein